MSRSAVIIIATRPESKRLPNKVFRKIAGVPSIEHILNRISGCNLPIVLAVPFFCDSYEYLKNKYSELDLRIYKGNPESPLHRIADAIEYLEIKEDWIVRITHDDILIDQKTMLDLIDLCDSTAGCGYGVSPKIIEGAGVEVIYKENILRAAIVRRQWTEYISYFVKDYPNSIHAELTPRKQICRPYRLTMDYEEDAIVLEAILRELGANAPLDKICEYIDRHPYVLKINHQPIISVYTCAYNSEDYVERTLDSILAHNQGDNFEYIFLDDASTDSTLMKALKYGNDKRVKYHVNQINKGLASSSNDALSLCRGKYVMRVDADDLILPYAMQTLKEQLENEQASVVYPAYKEINSKEETISDVINPRDHHHAGCALMDKRMINEIRFTDGLKHWDSKDLYNRINAKFKKAYAQEPLWYYRKHPKSLSANKSIERMKAHEEVMKNAE
jgi:spore coat polysaccharide biosynthesis protein SpsF (cytidylyltransferase family)